MFEVLSLLVLLSIVAALIAVHTPNLLHAVIAVGAVGLLLAVKFVLLAAPDLAIVQIGVEVIALVILIRATINREAAAPVATRRRPIAAIAFPVALVVAVGLFGLQVFADFPAFGLPVMERFSDAPSTLYLQEGLTQTGAPNIVTAVLLDFRAYDTLGEATVLFCAVIGVLAVLRRKTRTTRDDDREEAP